MKEIIKKYYFGAWQNMYHISWPIRFFIELMILIIVGFLFVKLICWVGKKLKIKCVLVKSLVWIVTEMFYLVGRDSDWAASVDNKMIDWGTSVINGESKIKFIIVKRGICLGIIVVYFLAVFVDLPVAKYFSAYYLEELESAKAFFQKFEIMISKDYQKYPPLFLESEKEEIAEEAVAIVEDRESIYIQLNERGRRGSNIRSDIDLDNDDNIIGVVDEKSEILYRDEWTYDGERYWIRVYIPADELEGWLSGNLVDNEQLEKIVN